MDREKFRAAMESDVWYSAEETFDICNEIAKKETAETNAMWLVEEMAELQQAIIKNLRGYENMDDVLQEIADVRIGLELLVHHDSEGKQYVNVADCNKAIDVKLDRDIKRIRSE